MEKPLSVIAIRTNIDWLRMNKEKFFAQGQGPITRNIFKPEGKWLQKHWNYIKLWDSMLSQSYFKTRHELQEFAEKTHNNVKGVDLILKGKKAIFKFIEQYKNDQWIMLPTDDDDCFHPNVVNGVSNIYNNTKLAVISWKPSVVCTVQPQYGVKIEQMQGSLFSSNGYALTNRIVDSLPHTVVKEMIFRHCVVRSYLNKFMIRYNVFPKIWSIYNKNPLSFSSTRRKSLEKKSIGRYFTAISEMLDQLDVNYPNQMEWIEPYFVSIKNILKHAF